MFRSVAALFAVAALAASPSPARAQAAGSYLSGLVTRDGRVVAGAAVEVNGPTLHRTATSDAHGAFAFTALPLGTYSVSATLGEASVVEQVRIAAGGTSVALRLRATKEIGRTGVSGRATQLRRGGTDVAFTTQSISRSPARDDLAALLLQAPGAARGANGVVHINGDHGDINYVVDGVPLPQAIDRVLGSEVDPSTIGSAEILEGAYPAQYGGRFGAVVDVTTRGGNAGPPGMTVTAGGGSFATTAGSLGYHAPIGRGGSLFVATTARRTSRALDPASPDDPHDAGSSANQFLRLSLPRGGADFLNVTLSHTLQTFQIPPDVANGAPPATDDDESQDDLFASLQYRHAIGDRGVLSFGPSVKRSRIVDRPDRANDFAAGRAAGAPADCSADVTACALSIFADTGSTDARFDASYQLRGSPAHEIRAGASYDVTLVPKRYRVAIQPLNPYSAGTFVVSDTAPNVGHTETAYLQDSWRMGALWQLDYGLRADAFQIGSSEFASGFSQLSPRLKLTRFLGPRAGVYAYFGRFFTPFSFQSLSPAAAVLLRPRSGSFDLLPQRDSDFEVGGHVAVGAGDLGLRVAQKNAADLIDDVQVGSSNLHQDINYAYGRIATQSALYQLPLARRGRLSGSLTHTYAVVKNCETQLLAPCFGGPARDWTSADHDQRWDGTLGVLLNDRHGGWWTATVEYGSGLTTAPSDLTATPAFVNPFCAPDPRTGVGSDACKVPPHLTLDLEKGFALGHGALVLDVRNALDDRYAVTFANAQGNHAARSRAFGVEYRLER